MFTQTGEQKTPNHGGNNKQTILLNIYTLSLFNTKEREKMIGCNLCFPLRVSEIVIYFHAPISHSITRFAPYTVPTRAPGAPALGFAPPCPPRTFPECSVEGKREMSMETRNG